MKRIAIQHGWNILGLIVFSSLAVSSHTPFSSIETFFYDRMIKATNPKQSLDNKISIIVIDDKSLNSLSNNQTIPRKHHQKLTQLLSEYNVKTIVWDLIFEQDRPEDIAFKTAITLAEESGTKTVMAFLLSEVSQNSLAQDDYLQADFLNTLVMPEGTAKANFELRGSASLTGFTNHAPDSDGVYRRVKMLEKSEGQWLPSLSLAAIFRHYAGEKITLEDGALTIHIADQQKKIPVDDYGNILIKPFVRKYSPDVYNYSYINQLETYQHGKNDPIIEAGLRKRLAGDLVFITAINSHNLQLINTPLDIGVAKPLLTISALNALLGEDGFITPASDVAMIIFMIALGLILFLLFSLKNPLYLYAGTLATLAIITGLFLSAFLLWDYHLPIVTATLLFLAFVLLKICYLYVYEYRKSQLAIVPALKKEVAEHSLSALTKSPVREELTTAFIDIANFTQYSAVSEPESVTQLLSTFYQHTMVLAEQYQGYVKEFLGDGVLIYWKGANKERNAIQMTMALQRHFKHLEDTKNVGAPFSTRCGITTDFATLGYIGKQSFGTYTTVGKCINLASRIQHYADVDSIVVDENTYKRTQQDFVFTALEPLNLKGFEREIALYQLITCRSA